MLPLWNPQIWWWWWWGRRGWGIFPILNTRYGVVLLAEVRREWDQLLLDEALKLWSVFQLSIALQ